MSHTDHNSRVTQTSPRYHTSNDESRRSHPVSYTDLTTLVIQTPPRCHTGSDEPQILSGKSHRSHITSRTDLVICCVTQTSSGESHMSHTARHTVKPHDESRRSHLVIQTDLTTRVTQTSPRCHTSTDEHRSHLVNHTDLTLRVPKALSHNET